MGFLDFFRPLKSVKEAIWKEIGSFSATFTPFGADMYKSEIVRSCIRPIAEHTSKAHAVCTDKRIEKILNTRPNLYMNGNEFLYKVRTQRELRNTAFIYIQRDDKGSVKGYYPVPYASFEGIEYNGRLFIKFFFDGDAVRELVLPWADLAVIRKDYNKKDISGDDNSPLLPKLDLIYTTNQGVANAVKATANLRGIIKSTKAMLSPADIKKQKDQFVKDYMNLDNEGGIASLDATQDFTPITMSPMVTSADTIKEFREDVQRYFGVNDSIIMNDYTEEQMEAFYEGQIETFLADLSVELTGKTFTEREQGFGNEINYESNRMNYASTKTKLEMVQLVDRGALTPNEWRAMFNLPPVDGGDVPIRRLDTQPTDEDPNAGADDQKEDEEDGEE